LVEYISVMDYQKFQPHPLLAPFVECYFIWESTKGPVKNLVVESPPNGFCSIVFNTGDPYFIQNKKYEKLAVPTAFIAGQAIYSYKLFLNGDISIAGIVFKPAGIATLFDLPVYEYTEERIDLNKIFPVSVINDLSEKLSSATEALQKAKLLEEFLLKYFEKSEPAPDYIDYAANLIVEKNGMLHVNDLLKDIYMSRRNFERRFFKKVGLSPKYYARIRRISYLMNFIAGKKKADWNKLFSECEYYDQSHFIKDFIEFTGRTPQQYLEENNELANLVEKPTQQPLV
jgi:AraC-like DNA-binding protein